MMHIVTQFVCAINVGATSVSPADTGLRRFCGTVKTDPYGLCASHKFISNKKEYSYPPKGDAHPIRHRHAPLGYRSTVY